MAGLDPERVGGSPVPRRSLAERAPEIARRVALVIGLLGAAVAIGYFGIHRRRLVIDRLAARARPELALPGPQVPPDLRGVEIALRDGYRDAPSTEDATVSREDRLAVINRWTRSIYPHFGAFMVACALDPLTTLIARELQGADPAETAANIRAWAAANLLHTQGQAVFEDMPGGDPWGALNVLEPAYGKVLPSEMRAKAIYTGKMTGKCCSLAAFIAGLFAASGARPEDIVVFRLRSHVIGLVRFGGLTYLINNQRVDPMDGDPKLESWVDETSFKGFFGYPLGGMRPVKVSRDVLSAPEGPLAWVARAAGASDFLPALAQFPDEALADREELFAAVFGAATDEALSRVYTLARYAYQSLYVRDPSLYLEASLREPTVRELARRLATPEQVIGWIRDNVSSGPIFEDAAERIMTADQVIVYRRGTLKDQALLFAAVLRLRGGHPVVSVTPEDAYVEVGGRIYEARGWATVDRIEGKVELAIGAD